MGYDNLLINSSITIAFHLDAISLFSGGGGGGGGGSSSSSSLFPAEQKGCHSGSKRCKNQPLISKKHQMTRDRRKNLNMAWIDYQKASHSFPYSWIEKSVQQIGMNNKIVKFCKLSMEKW
jgi:hypothetical protein